MFNGKELGGSRMASGLFEVVQELQQIQAEATKGVSALYDAEVRLADAEHAYERQLQLTFINNEGSVADRTAVSKLEASELRLQADLAKAEYNRVKTKLKHLEMAQMSLQTQARLLETELKTLR
jgi:hypothetical protein